MYTTSLKPNLSHNRSLSPVFFGRPIGPSPSSVSIDSEPPTFTLLLLSFLTTTQSTAPHFLSSYGL